MKRTWTIIGVSDVAGSFKWYQQLLGLPETAPAHEGWGQILDSWGEGGEGVRLGFPRFFGQLVGDQFLWFILFLV